jgi:hypothetical protein
VINYKHLRHSNLGCESLSYAPLDERTLTDGAGSRALAVEYERGGVVVPLHRFVQALGECSKQLEEERIHDNFVIIYELMDELVDFRYPQTTESKILDLMTRAHFGLPSVRSGKPYVTFRRPSHPRSADMGRTRYLDAA